MTSLRALAPAKINLGLFVGPTRADGRHELVSVMQSISLTDELTLEPASPGFGEERLAGQAPCAEPDARQAAAGGPGADEVLCPGAPGLAGPANLAARALAAFRRESGWDPGPLRLTIEKRVPVAAGLGGGSGDAAAALRLAARASGLDDGSLLERPAAHASGLGDGSLLERLAAELGADVPAQVAPGRWLALGAGERLRALPDPVEPFGVLVLPLAYGLSTAAVYAEADRMGIARTGEQLAECCERLREALAEGAQLPGEELLENDLQRAAVSLCPPIADALAQARAAGADVVLVSGSGPTALGLFGGTDGPERARTAAEGLAGRDPRPVAAVPVGAAFARVARVRNNGPLNPQQ